MDIIREDFDAPHGGDQVGRHDLRFGKASRLSKTDVADVDEPVPTLAADLRVVLGHWSQPSFRHGNCLMIAPTTPAVISLCRGPA